ncbi:MAG: hypothetical protein WAU02_03350 [Candidatus Saccharimonadales bacterium]
MEPIKPHEHNDSHDVSSASRDLEDTPLSPAVTRIDSATPSAKKSSVFSKLCNGMSWYGLELALSTLGLMVTAMVLTYGIYATVNYIKGIDNPFAVRYLGEFSLWVAASMIIWLPLAVVYYLRTRAEIDRHPATKERLVHKLFVGFFLFNIIIVIAAALFSVVYALIRIAVGIDDTVSDTLVRIVLPGILAAAVNIGLFWAYGKHQGLSRKAFALIVTGAGVLVTIVLLALSVTNVQAASRDEKASKDLSDIQSQITSYYSAKRSLPASLDNIEGLTAETKARLSRYDYKKETSTQYQLCATFATDTQKQQGYEAAASYSKDSYMSYADFSLHGTGEKCFKLTAGYSSYYDDIMNGSDTSGSLFNTPKNSSTY